MTGQGPIPSRDASSRDVYGDRPARQRRVAALAGQQKGNIGRDQLLALGVAAHTIDNWLKSGLLILKHRGVYRLGHEAVPEFSDELAAVMACGRGVLLSHRSAATLWRVLPTGPSTEPISVLVAGRDLRSRPGIRVHRADSLSPAERTTYDGIPVTAPARTLLDLAAEVPTRALERALNEARVLGLARSTELVALLARHPRHRGTKRLQALLDSKSEPGFTRSEAESRFLALVGAARLSRPRANVRVGGHEVDFLWPEKRVVVEVDGFRFHSSRSAFERDRARDAELAALGYAVIRVTWRQITEEPYTLVARLARSLVA